MPTDKTVRPDDTARIDLRELAGAADEAERRLLLLSIGAGEHPDLADALDPNHVGTVDGPFRPGAKPDRPVG